VSDLTTTVDTYLEAYSEPDSARRDELLEKVFAANGQLVDPPFEASGRQGVSDMVGNVLGQFPGHRFRRTSAIDSHHDAARYGWEMVAPDGTVTVAGIDVALLDDDGRLQRVTGFFGDLPAKS
jgi:hypothetical protein